LTPGNVFGLFGFGLYGFGFGKFGFEIRDSSEHEHAQTGRGDGVVREAAMKASMSSWPARRGAGLADGVMP
jgi:hypothetical protein